MSKVLLGSRKLFCETSLAKKFYSQVKKYDTSTTYWAGDDEMVKGQDVGISSIDPDTVYASIFDKPESPGKIGMESTYYYYPISDKEVKVSLDPNDSPKNKAAWKTYPWSKAVNFVKGWEKYV